jgi:Domain of unknown function (DUF5679)
MPKRSRPTDPSVETSTSSEAGGRARKRLRRLERELVDLAATEARRLEQLTRVRARAADVRGRLAALRVPGSNAATAGPFGYCMREKRRVQISHPQPVTLSNGRRAIAGTCPTCGARVTVLAALAAPTGR